MQVMCRKFQQEILHAKSDSPIVRKQYALRLLSLAKEYNMDIKLSKYPDFNQLHSVLSELVQKEAETKSQKELKQWQQQFCPLSKKDCLVCFETTTGFTCPLEHHICSSCLKNYLEVNLLNSRHKVKQKESLLLWSLPCVSPNCSYTFSESNLQEWLVHVTPQFLSTELTKLKEEVETELRHSMQKPSYLT